MIVSSVYAWLKHLRATCDTYDESVVDRGRACAHCNNVAPPLRHTAPSVGRAWRHVERVRKARSAGDAWGVDFQLHNHDDDDDDSNVCRLLNDEFAFLSEEEEVEEVVEVVPGGSHEDDDDDGYVRIWECGSSELLQIRHARENVVSVTFDETMELLEAVEVAEATATTTRVDDRTAGLPTADVVMWLRRLLWQCEWECGEQFAADALDIEIPSNSRQHSAAIDDATPKTIQLYDFSGVRKYKIDGQTFKLSKNEMVHVDDGGRLVVTGGGGGATCRVLADAIRACALEMRGSRERIVTLPDHRCVHLYGGGGGGGAVIADHHNVRHRLMQLFKKRPPLADLSQLGIYQNEGVFGNTLTQLQSVGGGDTIPSLVRRCVELVERPPNLDTEGLYRSSASLATLQELRFAVNARWRCERATADLLERYARAPDVLSGLLKLFVRELKESLIAVDDYDRLLRVAEAPRYTTEADRHLAAVAIVRQMAPAHRDTLELLLAHLTRVVRHEATNGMNAASMAICWGQTLCSFADPTTDGKLLVAAKHKNTVTALLLDAYKCRTLP